jgi:hypothetical protein
VLLGTTIGTSENGDGWVQGSNQAADRSCNLATLGLGLGPMKLMSVAEVG